MMMRVFWALIWAASAPKESTLTSGSGREPSARLPVNAQWVIN